MSKKQSLRGAAKLRGEDHPRSVVTEVQIREIRELRSTTGMTMMKLAERFPLEPSSIARICRKETWKHVV